MVEINPFFCSLSVSSSFVVVSTQPAGNHMSRNGPTIGSSGVLFCTSIGDNTGLVPWFMGQGLVLVPCTSAGSPLAAKIYIFNSRL